MEAFTYSDIFETKGIEYLVIIFFLLVLIPFWIFVNRPGFFRKQLAAVQNLTAQIIRVPQGIFFSKKHTWTNLDKNGNAQIGIDDFLVQVAGNVTVQLNKLPGEYIHKGEVMAGIDGNGRYLKVLSPISGVIIDNNTDLFYNLDLLKTDLFGRGWLYKVKPDNWKKETSEYYLAAEASEWIAKEIVRLKDFFGSVFSKIPGEYQQAVLLQEGGELINNPLAGMDKVVWEEFEKEFLL